MPEFSPSEELIPLAQAAERLHIKLRALYTWIHAAGMIPRQIDKKAKGLTAAQIEELARTHGRILQTSETAQIHARLQAVERRLQALETIMDVWLFQKPPPGQGASTSAEAERPATDQP